MVSDAVSLFLLHFISPLASASCFLVGVFRMCLKTSLSPMWSGLQCPLFLLHFIHSLIPPSCLTVSCFELVSKASSSLILSGMQCPRFWPHILPPLTPPSFSVAGGSKFVLSFSCPYLRCHCLLCRRRCCAGLLSQVLRSRRTDCHCRGGSQEASNMIMFG